MLKNLLAFLFCLAFSPLFGQFYYESYFYNSSQLSPCPFNPNVQVEIPPNWNIYQTQNGAWDGPIDSSLCLEGIGSLSGLSIDLSLIDPQRPLFVSAKAIEFSQLQPLPPNSIFNFRFQAFLSDTSIHLQTGTNCNQSLCSGAFIGIHIPTDVRFQTATMQQTGIYLQSDACFPSEFFQDQTLNNLVLKFQFKPGTVLTSQKLVLQFAQIIQSFDPVVNTITEVVAYPQNLNPNTGAYEVNVIQASNGGGFSSNFLMLYTAPGFPSASNPSFVEARPEPNEAEQKTINLIVEPSQNLQFQPFTYLRGALVKDNDSLRHVAQLVNNGGDMCLNFIDVVFTPLTAYVHNGGTIGMNHPMSCMQFQNKSTMELANGATLHYGNNGLGMMILCSGSTLKINPDATLLVDGTLNLSECNDLLPPQHYFVDLPKGAQLIFTKDARIFNGYSKGQAMHLKVRMLGGTIDDSALPAEDRSRIERIYPEPEENLADNLQLSPNPFETALILEWNAAAAETLQIDWLDVQGKVWWTEKRSMERGINAWSSSPNVPSGVYFLRFSGAKGWFVQKVVRM